MLVRTLASDAGSTIGRFMIAARAVEALAIADRKNADLDSMST